MPTKLSLKEICLQFLDRMINPNFENKAIWTFIVAGFLFISISQAASLFPNDIQIDSPYLKAKIVLSNSPSWVILSIGLALLAYGGFALYRLKISPPVKRRDEVSEMLRLLEASSPDSNNVQLQEYFLALFKVSASIPIIRFLLDSNDPRGLIQDYRFGRYIVSFVDSKFQLRETINLDRRLAIYSWLYYLLGGIALATITLPLNPFIDTALRKAISFHSIALGIALFVLAVLVLEPIRSYSAAKRLLAVVPTTPTEYLRDEITLTRLLSAIHTPTFDMFIEYGKTSFVYEHTFHFWERFKALVTASNFHLYDEELNSLVLIFFDTWEKSLSFGEYFSPTSNPTLYKFDSRMDIFHSKDVHEIHDEFIQAIWNSELQFRTLLRTVRRKFPRIDVEETNQAAWNMYAQYYDESSSVRV